MQCGVACIAMICAYYGKKYSSDTLNRYISVSADGVSLKAMTDLCEVIGMDSACGKLNLQALTEAPLPCVLHWKQNHFVVLYKISGKKTGDKDRRKFHIADPAKGKITYSTEELCNNWLSINTKNTNDGAGIAMFFEPKPVFGESPIETEAPRRNLRFLLGYLQPYKGGLVKIVLGLLIGSFLQLVFPFMMQWIVDIGIKNEDIGFIGLILLGELILVISGTVADFMRRWIILKMSTRINISLVSEFFIKLLKLPMSYFDTKLLGDLLRRIGDHDRIQGFLTGEVLPIIFVALTSAVLGIVLFIYNLTVFGVFMCGTILYAIWITIFLRKRKVLDYDIFEKEAINSNLTYRFVSSIQEIKLQSCEKRRRIEWEDAQIALMETRMRILKLQQTQEAGSIFLNELKNIIITVLTATAVINHKMTLGGMLAVQYIIGQLSNPIGRIMGFIYSLQDFKISLERINEVHNSQDEQKNSNLKTDFSSAPVNIRFVDLDIKYDPHSSRKILNGININIEEGKVTAIVGGSGSGKTTLIKLMLGYYHPVKGKIMLNNNNLDCYDMKWWRSRCGVVMQEGIIFSESIARNIAVSDGDIDFERISAAARIANAEDFILSLPLKYDTKIGPDGTALSLGQRQRILIARAVYKNPDFIFLDEATNSLDAKNERIIVENLSRFYRGRTVVVVAHRLSTVKNADNIIVLDEGKVVECGTHNELIRKRSVYYSLVKNQLELGC